jgi:hypothetical protein
MKVTTLGEDSFTARFLEAQRTQRIFYRIRRIDWIGGSIAGKVIVESPLGEKTRGLIFISKGTPHRSR